MPKPSFLIKKNTLKLEYEFYILKSLFDFHTLHFEKALFHIDSDQGMNFLGRVWGGYLCIVN